MWIVQPQEIADTEGKGTGRWRLTATSDEDGGGPFGDFTHDHASAVEADACELCDEFTSAITGFPSRKDRAKRRASKTSILTLKQIKHMVDRFLSWKLPEHFHPDAGISFKPEFNVEYNTQRGHPPQRHEPSGTNLLDATQAEAMVRYMIDGMPPEED